MMSQISDSHSFFQTGGSLSSSFPSYIYRPADQQLCSHLKAGRFCYILTARQMGKSSLRVRVMERLKNEGEFVCAAIDATKVGNKNSTADQWYYSILHEISATLGILPKLKEWWKEHLDLTPVYRFAEFIEKICLTEVKCRIIIFLDEIDSMLDLDKEKFSTDDFFAVVRSFYNSRVDNPELERLTFAFFGVATPEDLMKDPSRTPFNIGEAINLQNFSFEDTKPMLKGFGHSNRDAEALLKEILSWTNGHPYLTQKLCYSISNNPEPDIPISDFVKGKVMELFLSSKVQSDSNLLNVNSRILRNKIYNAEMISIYQRILSGEVVKSINSEPAQIYLKLSGLVVSQNGNLRIDNRIYQNYFNETWIEAAYKEIDHPFSVATQNWLKLGKSNDAVLRGVVLDEANKWAKGRNDLSEAEREFLDTSRLVQQKLAARKRLMQISLVFMTLISIALISTFVAVNNAREAKQSEMKTRIELNYESHARKLADSNAIELKKQKQIADSNALAAQSQKQAAESNEKKAIRQKLIADSIAKVAQYQKRIAEANANDALYQKTKADHNAIVAQRQMKIADSIAKIAQRQRDKADSLRLLSENRLNQINTQSKIIEVQPYLIRARDILPINPTIALRLAELAYRLQPDSATEKLLYSIIGNEKNRFYRLNLQYTEGISSVAFSSDGRSFATGGSDGVLTVRNTDNGNVLLNSRLSDTYIFAIKFSNNGKYIYTATSDNAALMLNAETGAKILSFRGHNESVTDLAVSKDDRYVATASYDGTVRLWETPKGNEIRVFNSESNDKYAVALSNNGNYILLTRPRNILVMIGSEKDRLIQKFIGHNETIGTVVLSSDNSLIVTGSWDKTAKLWETETGKNLQTFTGHREQIYSVDISWDNKYVITGSADNTVRAWDTKTGLELYKFLGHSGAILKVSISPDGKSLLTGSLDNTAKLWNTNISDTRKRIIESYQAGIPFTGVKELIKLYLASNEVFQLEERQKVQYQLK